MCGKLFKNRAGLANHQKYCSGDGTRNDKKKKGAAWRCPKCNKHIHSRRDRHVEICDGLGSGAHRRKEGPGKGWAAGKTYEEIYGPERAVEIKKKTSLSTPSRIAAWKDSEYRKRRSEFAKKNGFGGPTKRGGRGKHGWYMGYWCDSSWELAWVIYCLDNGIPFVRNKQGFPYEINGKVRKYYPDFQLPDGCFVEIKGYLSSDFEKKRKSFPHSLKVITIDEIQPILEYVIGRYGKNYIHLYKSKEDNDTIP
jgi:hypothetical protein